MSYFSEKIEEAKEKISVQIQVKKKEIIKKIRKATFAAIRAKIQALIVQVFSALVTFLGSLLGMITVVFLILVIFVYSVYLYQLESAHQDALEQMNQTGTNEYSEAELEYIIGSTEITRGGSGRPIGSPTSGSFTYSTFDFHKTYEHIYAIDFQPTKSKVKVKSTHSGKVLFIGEGGGKTNSPKWCPVRPTGQRVSYGKGVIIGNDDTGYVTVYLHFDSLNSELEVGDEVGYGTFLGYMGNTGCSSGKHLHYEIRKGEARGNDYLLKLVNGYFTTSRLRAKGYLPLGINDYLSTLGDSVIDKKGSKYRVDFSKEGYNRVETRLSQSNLLNLSTLDQKIYGEYKGTVTTPCGLSAYYKVYGNTEEERIREFLERRGTGGFGGDSYDSWINAGLRLKLDPAFLVCMGAKESSLGHTLKSRYNVGNVGNNDRGDVMDFSTPEEGIYAMGDLALNGTYLGHITSMIELTRCGDSTRRPIYASSDVDFQNLYGCTSALKNINLPFNWNFRINPENVSRTSVETPEYYDFYSDNSILKHITEKLEFTNINYEPQDLEKIKTNNEIEVSKEIYLREESLEALEEMSELFYKNTGRKLKIIEGYLERNNIDIDSLISLNFQTGLSITLFSEETDYEKYILDYKWIKNNGHTFGFIRLFPEEHPNIIRYVGKNIAKEIFESNVSYEEYVKLKGKK